MPLPRLITRVWGSDLLVSWGTVGVRLAGAVVVIPAVMVLLPPAEAAVWLLVVLVTGLAPIASFGLQPTFTRLLSYGTGGRSVAGFPSRPASAGPPAGAEGTGPDAEALRRTASTLAALGIAFAVLGLAAGGAAIAAATASIVAELAQPATGHAAMALATVTLALAIWGQIHIAWLLGTGRVLTFRRLELLTGAGQTASLMVAVALGAGLGALVTLHCLWVWIAVGRNAWLARRFDPFGAFARARPGLDREVLARAWPAQWRLGVSVAFSQGVIQASGILASAVAPPAEAASYLFHLRIATTISSIAQPAFYNRLPELAALWARGQGDALIDLARRRMVLAYWSFVAAYVAAGLLAERFVSLALARDYRFDGLLMAALGLAFFVERMAGMHAQLVMLANVVPYRLTLVSGTLAVLFGPALAQVVGVAGLPLGYLAGLLLGFLPQAMRRSHLALGLPWPGFERDTSMYPLLAVAIFSMVLTLI